MPDKLIKKAERALARGLLPFVDAQIAIAVDILLNAPIRPRNLASLDWRRHFKEPKGPKGHMLLYIPKAETKSGKRDLSFELPEDVSRKIRWYRREIMPRLGADPNGELFASRNGGRKKQVTLSVQTIRAIADHVGIHMTMHQFRHLAAAFYLEDHPEDFQTVSDLLGHAWPKTTLIYAGPSSRRAGRAFSSYILKEREALKLKRGRTRRKA